MSQLPLFRRLTPCGPVVDAAAAGRRLDELAETADAQGWREVLDAAAPALAPVLVASPYLAGLCRRWPNRLRVALESDPDARLAEVLDAVAELRGPPDAVRTPLRLLKADLHLLTALCDLGGVWDLDAVTGALSRFADAAVVAAFAAVAAEARERGKLAAGPDGPAGPIPGLFALAMGKHGAFELNYSSDIDVSFFHDPETLGAALAPGVESQTFADRCAGAMARLLSERTAEGYVFRVDLRLRPDPASTPPAVAAPAALAYYETVGQNWERAAFIKARPVGGDPTAAIAFLKALQPFVWRRSLDYAAIADVHAIKRQIHVHKADERLHAAGANLKLGRGGIREIEFFVQTQQLILGGRDRALRAPRTLDALAALTRAGHVEPAAAAELADAYVRLRALEHRVQMLEDEQTHVLPEAPAARAAVAAMAGESDLDAFDAGVAALLTRVNARYGELFAEDEPLSSSFGSLVFTGVENDPETLATLARMGFSDPDRVASQIRAWHHGRIPATRTARGRELFTRLAPRLLEAAARTGAPDAAFSRFAVFFEGLRAGVQVQSLFLAQPALFDMIVQTMAYAPRLAAVLSRQAQALDAIMDAAFFAPIVDDSGVCDQIVREAASATDFEAAMDAVRRIHREQAFRIGLHVLTGAADAMEAGAGFSDLADASVRALAAAALREVERLGGALPGQAAVIALGKFGSRELTAGSDLDLMTLYAAPPEAVSARRGWSADTFYGRFTQRLVAALSAHTAEGGLYDVDMRLRPSGTAGPVAVSVAAFADYYAGEAETWEFLALTRARVVWATDPAFAARAAAEIETALRRPRDADQTRADVADMRALMARERAPSGPWDLKLSPGGLVDCEFVAQLLQLLHAAGGGPLRPGTLDALAAIEAAGLADPAITRAAAEAWSLQQAMSQLIRCAVDEAVDPAAEPLGFQLRLAGLAGESDLEGLAGRLAVLRARARAAFEQVAGLAPPGDAPQS